MGCGAHLLVVGAEQNDEQRLRKAMRNERSVHPRGDDTSDGEASGTQMSLFRRLLKNVFSETQPSAVTFCSRTCPRATVLPSSRVISTCHNCWLCACCRGSATTRSWPCW